MIRIALLLWVSLFSLSTLAAIEVREFKTAEDEQRYQDLTEVLRCPKCQNQNIADSDAPLAKDLRREVYRMIDQGKGDDEVIDFMVTRYGDFVLYLPKKDASTWLLWYGPYVLLGLGMLVILLIVIFRRRKTAAHEQLSQSRLSSDEQAKLNELLNKESNS